MYHDKKSYWSIIAWIESFINSVNLYTCKSKKNIFQLTSFAIVGLINTIVDFVLFSFIVYLGLSPILANVISFSAGACNSFILNGRITFKKNESLFRNYYFLKFVIVTLITLGISHFAIVLLLRAGFSPYIGKIISIVITFLIGFLMNKFLVFSNFASMHKNKNSNLFGIELWTFVVALVIAAIPIFLVRVPPLLDYPNHYARLWLELGGASVPPVSNFYMLDWSKAGINIGIDLIAVLLQGIAPIGVVGPLVLCLALLLPPIGIALLGRNIHGCLSYWHILCVLLGWGFVFFYGFLNFAISLGLALTVVSFEKKINQLHFIVRSCIRSTLGYAIAVFHPFGFAFYIGLLSALTIGYDWEWIRSYQSVWLKLRTIIIEVAFPIFVFFIIIFMMPALPGSDTSNADLGLRWAPFSMERMINVLARPFRSYNVMVDVFFMILICAPVVVACLKRSIKVHFGLILLSLGFAVLSLLMPVSVLGTGGMDMRFPPMMVMAFAAAILPVIPRFDKVAIVGAALLITLIGVRSGYIGYVWLTAQKDIGSMQRSLEHLPQGARLLSLAHYPDIDATENYPVGRSIGKYQVVFWHYPALTIIDRHAFIPTLFTAAGKQPITVRSPYDSIAVREGILPGVEQLAAQEGKKIYSPKYLDNWRACFDYVLVLNADMPNAKGPLPVLPELQLISNDGFSTLYKVIKSSTDCFQ